MITWKSNLQVTQLLTSDLLSVPTKDTPVSSEAIKQAGSVSLSSCVWGVWGNLDSCMVAGVDILKLKSAVTLTNPMPFYFKINQECFTSHSRNQAPFMFNVKLKTLEKV